jgi:hypothetical protein
MRPPTHHFGNDITNTASNDNGNNNGGGNDDHNNNNRNNGDDYIAARIRRMGGTLQFPKIAGRGIIRVVGRCEDAKENSNLG